MPFRAFNEIEHCAAWTAHLFHLLLIYALSCTVHIHTKPATHVISLKWAYLVILIHCLVSRLLIICSVNSEIDFVVFVGIFRVFKDCLFCGKTWMLTKMCNWIMAFEHISQWCASLIPPYTHNRMMLKKPQPFEDRYIIYYSSFIQIFFAIILIYNRDQNTEQIIFEFSFFGCIWLY